MIELIEAIRVLRAALASGDRKAIRVAAAALFMAIGEAWLRLEQGHAIGDEPDESAVEVTGEMSALIEDLGSEVPKEGGLALAMLFRAAIQLLMKYLEADE
jgi:hypothetical protein